MNQPKPTIPRIRRFQPPTANDSGRVLAAEGSKEYKDWYKRGMELCKEAHEINLETIDIVFPPPP